MIPNVPREKIEEALRKFDKELRVTDEWRNWETSKTPKYKYAVQFEGRLYPAKLVVSMAAEVPKNSMAGGDQANTYLRRRGFTVVRLRKKGERCFWKVSAGEYGKLWPEFLSRSQIAVGFLEDWEGDVSGFESYQNLWEAIRSQGTAKMPKYIADQLWWFLSEMRPGDQVVVYHNKKIFGIGEITGPYSFVTTSDGFTYPHRRSVEWSSTELSPTRGIDPDLQSKLSLYQTINELTETEFVEICRLAKNPVAPLPDPFKRLLAHLSANNLCFAPETVANYLLALQSKRFVILTGISGTGKTRLAMAVAEFFQPTVRTNRASEIPAGSVQLEVFPYMLKHRRMIVPVELGFEFDAQDSDSPRVTVRYPAGEASLYCWKDPSRNVTQLNLSGEFRQWFSGQFKPGDPFLLRVDETPSGTPFLELTVPKTEVRKEKLVNHLVVAVRPDWTDNRNLLGYHNPITNQYCPTAFLDFLLAAHDECRAANQEKREPHPFFAILDEMNLARVEHYFSDFLSCLESEQPLVLHHDPLIEAGQTEDARAIPRQLPIPRNLFLTGTVNVDETTYMFSPKVLDRAFTIELNEVDLEGLSEEALIEDGRLVLTDMPRYPSQLSRPSKADWDELGQLTDGKYRDSIVEMNRRLAEANRQFGYRVACEIARYVKLAAQQAGDDIQTLHAALHLAILQKVLPKLHGTQQELEPTLVGLFRFALGEQVSLDSVQKEMEDRWVINAGMLSARVLADGTNEQPVFPRTGAKLFRMLGRLRRQGFASYIE